jgi:ankyrin repeat protein
VEKGLVNSKGWTVLHEAIDRRRMDVANELVQLLNESLLEKKDAGGIVPLHLAAMHHDGYDVCESLLHDRRVEVDVAEEQAGWTPLHVAASHGHADHCRLFLSYGANTQAMTMAYNDFLGRCSENDIEDESNPLQLCEDDATRRILMRADTTFGRKRPRPAAVSAADLVTRGLSPAASHFLTATPAGKRIIKRLR